MSLYSLKSRRLERGAAFTLVEMLVVMAIIAILAALTLAAAGAVMRNSMRSRASAEIQGMTTALEGYKTDNGIYPQTNTLTTNYTTVDVTSAPTTYVNASRLIYLSLSGQTNYTDTPVSGIKVYMPFKANQLGDPTGTSGGTYVADPWKYSYGYSTGTNTSYPFNGLGFFDLWSTGGKKGSSAADTNSYISNWQ